METINMEAGINKFSFLLKKLLIPINKNRCPSTSKGFAILTIPLKESILTIGNKINPSANKLDPTSQKPIPG